MVIEMTLADCWVSSHVTGKGEGAGGGGLDRGYSNDNDNSDAS